MNIKSIILEEYNKIIETPDNVILPSGQKIRCEQNDSYPFIVDEDNIGNVFVGNPGEYHYSFEGDINKMGINSGYKGRIWLDSKIITFWNYPNDLNELKIILKALEESLLREQNVNVNILNNPKYKIEVFDNDKDEDGEVIEISKLIPINQFKGEKYEPPQIDHLRSQEEKQRRREAGLSKAHNTLYHNKRKAYGTKSDSAAEYNFIKDRGIAENENYNNNIDSKLNKFLNEVRYIQPYNDINNNIPLMDNETIIVYHGFNKKEDALLTARFGLSGKEIAKRIYSYESGNNPNGLFVTVDFNTAKKFAYGGVILEFTAKVIDLEAPVWVDGRSYFIQGELTKSFKNNDERQKQQLLNREKYSESEYPAITNSDRPELAYSLYEGSEKQALFIGDLNPNMIKRFWIAEKNTINTNWNKMNRTEFLKKFYDEEQIKKSSRENSFYDKNDKLFLPAENFNKEQLKNKLKKWDYNYEEFLKDFIYDEFGRKNHLKNFFYPKQIKQILQFYNLSENINQYHTTSTPFAVFVLAYTNNNLVAATTRAKDKNEEGRIGLPGGKVDQNENPVDAAYRESYEEGWNIENINPTPIHKDYINGKLIWWYMGYNPTKLSNYKEINRIKPIEVTKEQIANSGYGNQFISSFN